MPRLPGPITISISLGTIAKAFLLVLLALVLYLLKDLVLVILVSVVIASAVEPATRFFAKYRIPRMLAVLIVYVITFGVFIALVPFFILPVANDLLGVAASLPAKIGAISIFNDTSSVWRALTGGSALSLNDLLTSLQSGIVGVSRGFVQTVSLVFGGFFSFIIIVVISFYLAVQPNGIENFLRLITPLDRENYVIDLWQRSRRKIGYWMQGQLLLGLLIGVLVFLGLTILQVPHALLLAAFAALFELIPFFGPVLAAVPAVLLGFTQSGTLGFMVIGFYLIIQQFENHLIQPLVVERMIGVPPMVAIIALIVGAKLAGFLGIILAVPLAAVLMEVAADLEKRKLARRIDV